MAKVCTYVDSSNLCQQWSELQVNWLDQLNQLSRSDANNLIAQIVGFWLICWAYKALLKFINGR